MPPTLTWMFPPQPRSAPWRRWSSGSCPSRGGPALTPWTRPTRVSRSTSARVEGAAPPKTPVPRRWVSGASSQRQPSPACTLPASRARVAGRRRSPQPQSSWSPPRPQLHPPSLAPQPVPRPRPPHLLHPHPCRAWGPRFPHPHLPHCLALVGPYHPRLHPQAWGARPRPRPCRAPPGPLQRAAWRRSPWRTAWAPPGSPATGGCSPPPCA